MLTKMIAESYRISTTNVLRACSRKTRQRCRCVARVHGPPVVSLLLASSPLSRVSEDCASTLEKHGSLGTRRSQASCLDSFPSIDTQASELALWTTPQLGVYILLVALATLGKSTSLEAIEATRLLHGFYVDESSACYV